MDFLRAASDDVLRHRLLNLISTGQFSKSDLALGSVDNTADLTKPVSVPQAAVLSTKLDANKVNAVNGVAGLDATGKLQSSQLPPLGISSLSDVVISSPVNNHVLTYDSASSKWANAAASGGGNINQTEIVVGVGESTSSPQTVTVRGPVGTGSSVEPGNLILQPPLGTGSYGSGNIVFQSSSDQNTVSLIYFSYKANGSSTSSTMELYFPDSTSFKNVSIVVSVAAFPQTTPTISIPGVSFVTLLSSTTNTTAGESISLFYAQNVTATVDYARFNG